MKKTMLIMQAATVAIAATLASAAHAEPSYRLSGYGTVGYTKLSNDAYDYRFMDQGESGSLWVDSRIGAQLDAMFNQTFSATSQVMVGQDRDGDMSARLEWLFVKAQLSPDWAVRVGRMAYPAFLASQYRRVGYAMTEARTPADVYGTNIITKFDGADLLGTLRLGGQAFEVDLFAGSSKEKIKFGPLPLDVDATGLAGLSVQTDVGPATVRAAYSKFTVDLPALGVIDSKVSMLALGARFDFDPIFVNSEFIQRNTKNTSSLLAYYATLGYRLGDWTPYITYSGSRTSDVTVGAPVQPDQKTAALGVRWDFAPNFALKAQYERIMPEAGYGNFVWPKNPLSPGAFSSANLLSLTLDFVF